ncbi:MAG: excinuclease ABC subunit UvrA [Pirellulaceae bacterium]
MGQARQAGKNSAKKPSSRKSNAGTAKADQPSLARPSLAQASAAPIQHAAIQLRGVRVHNLKNVDVDIPRGQLVAICGVSGSGKTSLAIDTLYAEGQRRYIESFSAYTRQFLERLDKPDYDRIDGLPPALAVTRSGAPRGNRSTVGTASESLDYLRLLFAKISEPYCYQCGKRVVRTTPQSAAQLVAQLPAGARLMIGFEVTWDDVSDRAMVLAELQSEGFVRLLSGGQLFNLGQDQRQDLAEALPKTGTAWVIVDRLKGGDAAERSTESLEVAFSHGLGEIALLQEEAGAWLPLRLSHQLRCTACGIDYPDPEPRLFNFNSPLGACTTCEGFGDTIDLDIDLIVPDKRKTLREGALAPWTTPAHSHHLEELADVADELSLPLDVPFSKLTKKQIKLLIEGDPKRGFGGMQGFFAALERKKYKMHVRVFLSRWRSYNTCQACDGARLNSAALAFRVAGRNFAELCAAEVRKLSGFLEEIGLEGAAATIAGGPLESVQARLNYLCEVGLGYLSLNRPLRTLSGGEAQRTALTAALGSSLVNMLYVLDEPSVGLHPHDVEQLSVAIERLARRGNTVIMIEHEEALISLADWLVEVGPAAGEGGGTIVYSGPRDRIVHGNTLTGEYLSGRRQLPMPVQRRAPNRGALRLLGCQGNNLKNIDVEFPLGVLCLVTGVSGSGKSSLVQDTLFGAVANRLTSQNYKPLHFNSIEGTGLIDDCILVDQSAISRSPRSNPVTYIKAFDEIRKVFAETTDAKLHNYSAGHFSFNSELGRCPTCQGDGALQIDMQFLADVTVVCSDCRGDRYRPEILQVRYRDRNIAEVLHMTVREASQFFRGAGKVQQKLKVLSDVGLGYLQLGQAATTLSSGEGQRLKLAAYLASATRRKTLFILDEPTTGLHTSDIVPLLDCFDALIEFGHSLIVVEHNLHLMAVADHIIDIGPGPADEGGNVVVSGTPEQVVACNQSLTGKYLQDFLLKRNQEIVPESEP